MLMFSCLHMKKNAPQRAFDEQQSSLLMTRAGDFYVEAVRAPRWMPASDEMVVLNKLRDG